MRESVVDLSSAPIRNLMQDPKGVSGAGWVVNQATQRVEDGYRILVPSAPGSDTFFHVGPVGWAWKTNTVYTLMGRMRSFGTHDNTNIHGTQVRSIWPYFYGGPNTAQQPNWRGFVQAPDVAGDYELRMTFSTPPTITSSSVRLYGGRTYDLGWKDVMLVEGDYKGPYLDGDSPGWRWTGAPNSSVSVGYPHTPNLLVDPSLQSTTNWNLASAPHATAGSAWGHVAEPGRTGIGFARAIATGVIKDVTQNVLIPVKPGDRLYCEAWFRRVSADADTSPTGEINLGASIRADPAVVPGGYYYPIIGRPWTAGAPRTVPTTWTKASGTYTVLAGAQSFQIRPSVRQDVAQGVFDVDDILVRRV